MHQVHPTKFWAL